MRDDGWKRKPPLCWPGLFGLSSPPPRLWIRAQPVGWAGEVPLGWGLVGGVKGPSFPPLWSVDVKGRVLSARFSQAVGGQSAQQRMQGLLGLSLP